MSTVESFDGIYLRENRPKDDLLLDVSIIILNRITFKLFLKCYSSVILNKINKTIPLHLLLYIRASNRATSALSSLCSPSLCSLIRASHRATSALSSLCSLMKRHTHHGKVKCNASYYRAGHEKARVLGSKK